MIKFEKHNWNLKNTWFISDIHGFHKNICKGTTDWKGNDDSTRDFNNEELMTEYIVNNINQVVGKEDLLIHLGDWTFNGSDNIKRLRNMINCNNIINIYGNHDHILRDNSDQYSDLFIKTGDLMYLQIDHIKMLLCHYPMYVWHQGHKGAFMLHGHSHSSISNITKGKILDVGIDSAFKLLGDYKPFNLLTDIIPYMNNRELYCPDHHQASTN